MLVKGEDYLYFAVAMYRREIEGTIQDVGSDPSNVVPIKGPNHAPMANAQSVIAAEDTPASISLTGSDADTGDVLTYAVTAPPAHGTLSGTAPNLTYTPALNYYGPDSFAFTVSDGTATSAPATVGITVEAMNDAPVAVGQSVTTLEDTPSVITLTGSDVDGDALTSYVVTAPPAHGTLSGTAPNLTYTPALNYSGPDSFTFAVSDGTATSAPARIDVTVTAVNDAPVAVNDTYPMPAPGTPLIIPVPGVLGNDTDVESASLKAVLVSGPSKGTLNLNQDGSFTYTPSLPISGSDSFTYRASDGSATSASAADRADRRLQPDRHSERAAGRHHQVEDGQHRTDEVAVQGRLASGQQCQCAPCCDRQGHDDDLHRQGHRFGKQFVPVRYDHEHVDLQPADQEQQRGALPDWRLPGHDHADNAGLPAEPVVQARR